jgi:hypothetical protein
MRTVSFLVAALLVSYLSLAAPVVKSDDLAVAEIARLREEINLLNLFNGLNLTTEQIGQLRSCASEAKDLREAYFNQASQTVTEAVESFRELRVVLAQNNGLPKRVETRAALSNERLKELTKQYDADIRELEQRAIAVLAPAQRVVLEEFKPCLIPPKNLKNPVRAGQAANRERGVELIGKLRRLPEPTYNAKIDEIAEKRLEMYEKHRGKLSAKERTASIARFKSTVGRARKMDDTNFQLEKEELAKQIEPRDDLAALLEKAEVVRSEKFGKLGKGGRFLLSPAAIGIYEERVNGTSHSYATTKGIYEQARR